MTLQITVLKRLPLVKTTLLNLQCMIQNFSKRFADLLLIF